MEEEVEEKAPYWVGFLMVFTGALLIAQAWPHGWGWRATIGWLGAGITVMGIVCINGRARESN